MNSKITSKFTIIIAYHFDEKIYDVSKFRVYKYIDYLYNKF